MTYNVEKPEHAWLNLTNEDIKDIQNPLEGLSQKDKDNLHLYILCLKQQPEYFQWTVKKNIKHRASSRTGCDITRVMESCISDVYSQSWLWQIIFIGCI